MEDAFLLGDDIYLRPLRLSDVDGTWVAWLNDQAATLFMANGTWPVTREDQLGYYQSVLGSRTILVLAICLNDSDRHIGNVSLGGIDLINRRAELGILIGDTLNHKKGLGSQAIRLISRHGFDRLNLHKIWARIEEGNIGAKKAFLKAGFRVEGTLEEEILHHGKWRNSLYLGLIETRMQQHDC